jgi:hypothetical protein
MLNRRSRLQLPIKATALANAILGKNRYPKPVEHPAAVIQTNAAMRPQRAPSG